MPPFVSKFLFIVISHSLIFHSWREFLCSIVGKEANCPWHWTKCPVPRLIAAVIECFNCSRLHLNCDQCTTQHSRGRFCSLSACSLLFVFTASSQFLLLFWPLLYLQHTMARHQGLRCFTAKTPLPCFIDIHVASCYDDQDMIMQCRMLLRPFVCRPRVGGVFRPRCLYQ